jgi:8-oxo-dGTP pyrophosphatase MutT (NUDIX family)
LQISKCCRAPGVSTFRVFCLQELFEETCISSVEVVAELPRWLPYEFPTSVRCKLQGTWANYKGQAQRWFLLKFTGEDAEINLDTDHKEFDQWRWMPLEQLPDTVIEFKREVYREVVAEFKPVLERLKKGNGAN